ncbi:cell envelope biogenesis protein OmpA [Burkholderia diffusa]|uniref:OmpA family protein n=1 Tax=Burkholderia diffusa TaxID=488732 RepID=UPI00075255E4|nr:cell envelope biogenesis protein OmpA [Burkholderia diffusa]
MFALSSASNFVESSKMAYPQGVSIEPEALSKLHVGMSKDQVRDVLGDRQYNGNDFPIWHRWDYIFSFPDQDGVLRPCQYQVRFFGGQAYRGYWADSTCRDLAMHYAGEAGSGLGVIEAAPCKVVGAAAPLPEKVDLAADALFAFDKGDLDDISADGRRQLSDLVASIKARILSIDHLVVTGYTDRLGSEEHNALLSSKRAHAVADYMIAEGIPAAKISVVGKGAANPVVACDNVNQADLIRCLGKNRRVEVRIEQK